MFRVFPSEGLLMISKILPLCLGLPLCSFKKSHPWNTTRKSFICWAAFCYGSGLLGSENVTPTGADLSFRRSPCWTLGKAGLSQVGRSPVPVHGRLEKWSKNWYSATILDLHQTPLYPSKLLMISASSQKEGPSVPLRAFPVSARGLTLSLGSLHAGYYALSVSIRNPPQKLWAT